ncbi:MAG: murein L,D-transpeptidase catalytic domain family protein [Terrimonas ferruginea]|uniref:murein L,D-transpeptidase catalytic domain-containing protein n=1 Tax=Terrimonas ferruginea TaxID=249 RepID=UPI000AF3BC21|nr:murein L,D-transpeptidase catalytic domain family protein [Terrimonas ferruginea]MBN8781563.1 murein L,D-transpeptidase catalytic domain family protein [Terrimonas ferruginea]
MKPFRLLLLLLLISGLLAWWSPPVREALTPRHTVAIAPNPARSIDDAGKKVAKKAEEARRYVRANRFNDQIVFLIDMQMASGQPRFFVYHLGKDSVINSGLVTHGRCNENWLEGRKYGNTVGCGCTSLGKYKIGYPYKGRFGLAYKLYGLEASNNKAFDRFVVLHSHECVPEIATAEEICQSDGCPTVSPGFLQYLKPVIDRSSKPVLLWIYE